MSFEFVRDYLTQFGLAERIREFPVSSATVALAAEAAGCEPGRIGKTLSFLVENKCVLIVCAGDARIDNAKFKAQFHCKATMLTPVQVISFTGHAVGGVCPFAITNDAVRAFLDVSLKAYETVFPAAGSDNSAVELSLDELHETAHSCGWIDVCKELPAQDV